MASTITEKILAAHCGEDSVHPGQFIMADVDLCLGNDITAPLAIEEFERAGFKKVWDRSRIALTPDHFTPNKDIKAATMSKLLRTFAAKHDLEYYFEVGRVGIEHALLPEQGLVGPGDLIIGADSHTCTYGALGAFATGVGSTDLGACFATGQIWLRVPESIKFVFKGQAAALGRRQGPDPLHHRPRSAWTAPATGHGVLRPGHRGPADRRPADHVQHGHRGRRQERHRRAGRHHARLPARAD